MKRVLTVFVVTILFSLLPFNIIASAAEDEPGTRFQYISSCSSTLTTSGTTASAEQETLDEGGS